MSGNRQDVARPSLINGGGFRTRPYEPLFEIKRLARVAGQLRHGLFGEFAGQGA